MDLKSKIRAGGRSYSLSSKWFKLSGTRMGVAHTGELYWSSVTVGDNLEAGNALLGKRKGIFIHQVRGKRK